MPVTDARAKESFERGALWVHRFVTCLPFLWFALFSASVVLVRLDRGYWPRPFRFDPASTEPLGLLPRDPSPGVLGVLFTLVTLSTMAAILVYPGLEVVRRRIRPASSWVQPILFLGGYVGFWVLIVVDPGGTFSWFMD